MESFEDIICLLENLARFDFRYVDFVEFFDIFQLILYAGECREEISFLVWNILLKADEDDINQFINEKYKIVDFFSEFLMNLSKISQKDEIFVSNSL